MVAHWNDSPWIDFSLQSDTLSCIQANQSFPFLLYAVWLAEKQQIPISVFDMTQSGLEHKTYHTRSENANHYTIDVKRHTEVNEH